MRSGGFFNGTNASLVPRAIDAPLRVGVLLTPVASRRTVDIDAAVRLVGAASEVYGFGIEVDELERLTAEIRRYNEGLTRRFDEQSIPEDRGFMWASIGHRREK